MSNTVQDVLGSLNPGDIIRTTRTHRVLAKQEHFVKTADVQNGDIAFGITLDRDASHGSLKVEIVKKAAPKPKVGDVLSANEVRAVHWKRGTVLRGDGYVFVLQANGEWFSPGKAHDSWYSSDGYSLDVTRSFADLDRDSDTFTVVHLP